MQTNQWGEMLDPNAEVVVCCVHGHNVSQIAAAKLRSHGVKARFLEGGTEGFLAAGGPSVLRKAWPHLTILKTNPVVGSLGKGRRSTGWLAPGSSSGFSIQMRRSSMSKQNG
jgi:hypothetical protein